MSEKRFDRIEARLDGVDVRFDKVDARLDKVDVRLDKVDDRLDKVDDRLGRLEHGQQTLRADVRDLRRYMGVLHEEVMDHFKVLTFDPEPLRREFTDADNVLREEINRRLDPIETLLRPKRDE